MELWGSESQTGAEGPVSKSQEWAEVMKRQVMDGLTLGGRYSDLGEWLLLCVGMVLPVLLCQGGPVT